ncbi:phosphoribosyltransferase [Streptomyces sp. NPDC058664]|uniref:phosphoribosyltransferase n=1 Tax=unclassified Streptomyces TaxID=2593676 RepID=UPI00366230EE
MRFHDHRQAGQELAARLVDRAGEGDFVDPVVLALPRGGVPVAAEVARALGTTMDVLVARKIGMPDRPEVGVGAVAGEDPPVFDEEILAMLGMSEDEFASEVARQRTELHRREDLYRQGRPAPATAGRTVVLVDDGLATGVTARAALRRLRGTHPARLILAVPVCSPEAHAAMLREADEVFCLHRPDSFRSVGQWYEEFPQITDGQVISTLRNPRISPAGTTGR